MKIIKPFLFSISFLTIVPINIHFSNEEIKDSIKFFPLSGFCIGLILYFADKIFNFISPEVRAFLILFLWEFLSGFFHLDGLADTSDAIFSAKNDRRKLFEIMKDSRIGTMGVCMIFFVLMGKFILLKNLIKLKPVILIIIPVIGRFSINFLSWRMKYAKETGLGKFICENNSNKNFAIALILTSILCLITKVVYFINFILIIVILYFFTKYFQKKFGGVTGDIFGFSVEITELLFLFIVSFN